MKHNKLILFALFAAAAFSCTKEISTVEQPIIKGSAEISASFAEDDIKTTLGDSSAVLWQPGDQISVFYEGDHVKFTSINKQTKAHVIFQSEKSIFFASSEEQEMPDIWAVYPYSDNNEQNGDNVILYTSSNPTAQKGTFARGSFPSVGRSKTTNISFYNVCGGFCFTVGRDSVTRVVFKSNGSKALSGKVKVGFNAGGVPEIKEVTNGVDSLVISTGEGFKVGEKYYLPCIPVVLNDGFTVSLYTKDKVARRTSSKSNEIKRSIFANLGQIDAGLTYKDIKEPEGIEAVDLGLSVKWANCNLGAANPEEAGRYFAWGDVVGQTWNGSAWSGGGFWSDSPYSVNENNNLKPEYDAAHVILGGSWRMATKAEFDELKDNCTSTWVDNYKGTGISGRIFTSKKTGYTDKSIFLPAAGYGSYSSQLYTGSDGDYWSSSFNTDSAWYLYFNSGNIFTTAFWINKGKPVRPVNAEAIAVTSVSLSANTADVYVGRTYQLTATVNPSNATDKSVTWSSSKESVATVSSDGLVTGVSTGTATITATTIDGGYSATCSITVEELSSYVDLGLSVKWGTCNIGATKPEEYGRYFAWGDVTGQTWDGSKWSGGGFSSYPTYEVDSNNNLKPAYDAAHVMLGGNWRMPTKSECQELIDNCTCTWTDNYNSTGVAGRIFTSNKTGYTDKSIFLPAAGLGNNSSLSYAGSGGNYWSSTFYNGYYAWSFNFNSSIVNSDYHYRDYGQSVRPVTE